MSGASKIESALPWRVAHDQGAVIILGGPFGRSVIARLGEGEQAEADARLIVACVNVSEASKIDPDEEIGIVAGDRGTIFHKADTKHAALDFYWRYSVFNQGQIDGDYAKEYRPCRRCWPRSGASTQHD